jgi:hypothetical protein
LTRPFREKIAEDRFSVLATIEGVKGNGKNMYYNL